MGINHQELKKFRTYIFSIAIIISMVFIFSSTISDVSAADTSTVYVNTNTGNNDWNGLSSVYNSTTKSGPKASISNATGIVDNGGTIRIADGTYSSIDNGNLNISKNLTLIGQSRANTIISTHFINDISMGCSVKLFNMTIIGAVDDSGGAIKNHGNLTANSVSFTKNIATKNGGAILNSGNLNLNNCLFYENLAGAMGGAIYNSAYLTVTNTSFERNNASAIVNNGTATIMRSDFLNNIGIGGAAYNMGMLTVNCSRIVDNEFYGPTFYNDMSYLPGATLNASSNWWGSNDDPSYFVVNTVINSWIVTRLHSTTSLIPKNGHTFIMFDLLHDNLGNLINGYLPDGIEVSFTTSLGNITSKAYTVNGTAISTLTAGTVGGTATIGTMLDKASTVTTVTIDVTAPTASSNVKSGIYNTTKIVSITMNKKGTIYYTLNGSTPTTTSNKYTGFITISSSKLLKFFAMDTAGNRSPVYSYNYTVDKTAPKIISTIPSNLKTGVSKSSVVYIKFTETMASSINYTKITVKSSSGKSLTLSKSIKGNILTIKTSSKTSNTWYTVTIPKSAIKDVAGNQLTANYSFKFKTGS